jgi:hypothetical protein
MKLQEIRRILVLWPLKTTENAVGPADDSDELIRGYLLAVDDYSIDDVTAAVDTLIKGTAPGVNPSFRPRPSEVGAECRRQMNLRLEHERIERLVRPQLPPPMVEHSDEDRERVKARLDAYLSDTGAAKIDGADREIAGALRRANERFKPSDDPIEMKRRLGFEVGDPDGETGDMGGTKDVAA